MALANEFSEFVEVLFDQDTTSAAAHTHEVPAGEEWIITAIIAKQASQQSTAYWQVSEDGTTYSPSMHFDSDRNTGAAVSEYIEHTNIKLKPGGKVKITFETFVAGDTVNTTLIGYKMTIGV